MKTTYPNVNKAYALIIKMSARNQSGGQFPSGEGMDPTTLFTARGGAREDICSSIL